MKRLFPVHLTSLVLSFKRTADLLNAFNFFLKGASRHSSIPAGDFCSALRADLQRRGKQNYFPRGKLKLIREKNMGVLKCMDLETFC